MGLLSNLMGGGMMGAGSSGLMGLLPMLMQQQGQGGGHGGEGQQPSPQQPSLMGRLGNLATDPMFQHNKQMATTGQSSGLPPPRAGGVPFPQQGMQPPQMPPPQGGLNALMGGFSTSPEFQGQLGAIHGGTSPGYQQPQYTPPQTPVPPFNANAGGRNSGRSFGGVPIRSGFMGFPGGADDDILRRFLPQAPTRL